jgi:hypothetical protein
MSQWLWIMDCHAVSKVLNHGELCWASDCESWRGMLRQWLWIMVNYAEGVVANHVVLCWARVCELLCFAEPVVVNHGVLYWARGCESWCIILSQLLWIMVCYTKPSLCESWCIMLRKVVVNHYVLYLTQWLGIMVCYAEPVVVNHGLLCWASGSESWCGMLSQW